MYEGIQVNVCVHMLVSVWHVHLGLVRLGSVLRFFLYCKFYANFTKNGTFAFRFFWLPYIACFVLLLQPPIPHSPPSLLGQIRGWDEGTFTNQEYYRGG